MKLYFNNAEIIIEIENKKIILAPSTAKSFTKELKNKIMKYEKEYGVIKLDKQDKSFLQSLMKNMFYTKKVSKKLFVSKKKK